MWWFLLALAALAAVAGVLRRRRVRRAARAAAAAGVPRVTDELVRRIEREGRVAVPDGDDDERLDLEEIRREEERFWAERWDEPEEL